MGSFLYRIALHLLPVWLRRDAGQEMHAAAAEGAREASARGHLAAGVHWVREVVDVITVGLRARLPDAWTRRTRPAAGAFVRTRTGGEGTMGGIEQDIRGAVRTLVRRPALMLLTGVTLSLGIGASTAMFSVVQSVLLQPLPYPAPDELVAVYPGWPAMRGHPTMGDMADRGTWSWPEFFGVAEVQESFSQFAAWEVGGATLTGDGPAQRVVSGRVSWQLFPMLGLTPAAGRLFHQDDESGSRVVVLSHATWRDRFGSDPDAVGRTMVLNDASHLVAGVLPPGFDLAELDQVEVWFPSTGSITDAGVGNHGGARAIGRLAPGVSIERAREATTTAFAAVLPPNHGEHQGSVYALHGDLTRNARGSILIMLAASVLLLLVACTNAAALLLGAGLDRARELALRGALGAPRSRIIRQLLAESLLIGLFSVLGGVVATLGLTWLLLEIAPTAVPGLDQAAIDPVVLAFAAGTALVFGAVFGLIPALSLSGVDLAETIGAARAPTATRARLHNAIVVVQLGLATVLVVSGALLVRTVVALDGTDPGFEHEELAAFAVAVPWQRFTDAEGQTDDVAAGVYERGLLEDIEAMPGVTGAATTSAPPFTSWRGNNSVWPEGWDGNQGEVFAERRFVSPNFFAVAGIEIIEGVGFEDSHLEPGAGPVVVISEGLAALGWPEGSPIGSTLSYWGREATILGVARNLHDHDLEEATQLAFYAPRSGGPILVRTAGDPAALVPTLRARIHAYDEDLPILFASGVSELIVEATAAERYRARLMTVFAGLSCLLALLGIYGVTSRAVTRRTREIGVRVALGAEHGRVWSLVTRQALGLGLAGAVAGAIGSLAAGGTIRAFLYGVSPTDPLTYVLVLIVLPVASVAAATIPARRAMKIDPLEALRAE